MTLISHDHRFIFLKTRKTAGTSTEMFLQPFCTPPDTPVQEWGEAILSEHGIVGQRLGRERLKTPPKPGVTRDVWFSHHPARGIKRRVSRHVWRSYEKITVVRNPYTKVLSGFFWRNRDRDLPKDHEALIQRFRQTVADGNFSDDRDIVFVRGLLKNQAFVPQTILKKETLGEDLQALATRLGLDMSRTQLPVTKSTGQAMHGIALSDWYDDVSADMVRKRLDWMFRAGAYPEALT